MEYTYRDNAGKVHMLGNVTANLTNKVLNEDQQSLSLTSTLAVHNFKLNNTELTCNGSLFTGGGVLNNSSNDTVTICITGD